MKIEKKYCRWCSEDTEHVGDDCLLCRFRAMQAMDAIFLQERAREAEGAEDTWSGENQLSPTPEE